MLSFIVGTDDARPHELIRFIEHLKEQTSQDYEIIIADEGSGANIAIATRTGCRYYWQPDARDWHYSAKNMAAKLAKGTWLAFPQDDAVYRPRFVELMQPQHELLAVCGWFWTAGGNRNMPPDPAVCRVDVGGFTVKADHFSGFDPGPLADGQLVQKLARLYLTARIPEVLYEQH